MGLDYLTVVVPAQFDRTFESLQRLIMNRLKKQNQSFFESEDQADKIVSWSESADRSRAMKSATKMRDTKS